LLWRLDRTRRRILKDPKRMEYTDLALTPVEAGEMDTLEIFNATQGGRAAVAKLRQRTELLHGKGPEADGHAEPVGAAAGAAH
jgi:hypothetical protein